MKIDRLIGIIIYLLRKDRVQAKSLADVFEVSVRTIYRDLEAINRAGIPIISHPGRNGGIGIADGFRLERNVLSQQELATIITALNSVSTSKVFDNTVVLAEKLKSVVSPGRLEELNSRTQQVLVDYSPWGGEMRHQPLILEVRAAIESSRVMAIQYCDAQGSVEDREIEPHTLLLKGQKWYLNAYCHLRQAFRLFKISRIKQYAILDREFTRRSFNPQDQPWEEEWKETTAIPVLLCFRPEMRLLIEEWFGDDTIKEGDGDRFLVSLSLPEDNWLYGYILSFGSMVEVVEPLHIREIIRRMAEEIVACYT